MKKILLLAAAAVMIGTAAQAQNDVKKQQGGEQNLEFLFAPLGGNPIGINGIKYRSFTSATTAWRATIFIGFSSDTDKMLASDGKTELKSANTNFDIVIAPGIESHFAGTDALSPYVGAEASLGFSRTTSSEEGYDAFEDDVYENKTKDGSLSIGVNGFAGMDWYFAHRIYLGAEMGFGVQFTTEFDTVMESDIEGVDDVESPNGSSINVGPNVVGQLRLGFLF